MSWYNNGLVKSVARWAVKSQFQRQVRKDSAASHTRSTFIEPLEPRVLLSSVLFDPTGMGSFDDPAGQFVAKFEWQPGNTLAENGGRAIDNKILNDANVGQISDRDVEFEAFHQAKLGTFNFFVEDTDQQQNADQIGDVSGKSGDENLTMVVGFRESVSLALVDGFRLSEFTFVDSDVDFVEIYFNDPDDGIGSTASDLSGTGFNNGRLIMKAGVSDVQSIFLGVNKLHDPNDPMNLEGPLNPGGIDYPGQQTIDFGSIPVTITAEISYIDPAFFQVSGSSNFAMTMVTDVGLNTPFVSVNPGKQFVREMNDLTVNPTGWVDAGPAPVVGGPDAPAATFGTIGQVNADSGDEVFNELGIGTGQGGVDFIAQTDISQVFEAPEVTAMLGDFVWEDLNANGIQDPNELDDGINGVAVKLLEDTNDDGIPETVVANQITSDNPDTNLPGWYKFNGLTPGVAYAVMFTNPDPDGPDAYMFSPRQVGADPAVDSDGPMSDPVVLTSGEFNPTIDAGLFRKGSIHVFGFLDVDGDGIQDDNEGAFPDDPGKTFELLDENGDVIMTDSTMDGMVWFEQLTPGTYTVRENPIPDGFNLTTLPNERTFTIISGQELVYEDGAAMLPAGDERFETNLGDELRWGNTALAMLGDYVWDDKNADGIQDAVDVDRGINGATVKLLADTDNDGVPDTQVDQTVTADNPDTNLPGFYKFNSLTPGVAYQVMFVNPDEVGPDAYMVSPFQAGNDPAADSDANSADNLMSDVVVLSSGEFNNTIDAGFFRKGSIHVFGYLDVDGDGNFDTNEGAFPDDPGKTFELLDENGNVIETQRTMDGMVWFEQLTPGDYTVRENPIPDGFGLTTLPNERTFTVMSGVELVYEDGAAMLDPDDERTEMNIGDELRWGNSELAMLGDFVWEDLNADGIQDAGEPGIAGVKVTLTGGGLDGVIGTGDDTMAMMVTDANGLYKFNGLNPGEQYKVTFTNPDDVGPDAYMFSPRQVDGDPNGGVNSDGPMSDIVTLVPGEFNDTLDAGLFRKGSIHVFGYLDVDGDGNFDPEDGAFPDDPGKTFNLINENGIVLDSMTTEDGMVWFEQLVPGTYIVLENPIPDGYDLTTLPNERTFTIISGQELVYEDGAAMLPQGDQRHETNLGDELRWGNTERAMLGDFVWEDLNANGIQDPNELDDGINGVAVKLLEDTNNDGIPETVVANQITSDNPDTNLPGWYKFNGLMPGVAYAVMFTNPDPDGPDAYMFSPRQVGADPAVDSDGPMSDPVVLASGEFNPTIDAGLFRKGSIHVFGFLDVDGDGIQDDNEGAFPDDPGKTFELLDANGDVIMTDSTMDGMVWFEQLTPGTYTVRENPIPDGFDLTTLPNERTFTIISGQELVYEDGAAMLPAGDERFETNLGDELKWGNTSLAMLGDFVFEDENANGIQDPEDMGIANVKVTLTGGGADGVIGTGDDTMEMMLTDANGLYKFNNLNPGEEYKVTFTNPDPDGPDAYMFSPRQVGADPAIDSDGPMSDIVTLAPGEFNDTLDAGLFRKGSIHVFGYLDVDGDGNFDPEDVAFPDDPGKTFNLINENGIVLDSMTTKDGMVWFEQLVPGTYIVLENPIPDGYALTTLPNERRFTIISGEELVYEDGAAMLPAGDERFETNLGDELRWGNTRVGEPDIDLEKFVRVDLMPMPQLDIEKLVRVAAPAHSGDVCDQFGKPVELTFDYIPGTDVLTDQSDASATGTPDNDGSSYVVVTDRHKVSDVLGGSGEVYFNGIVDFDKEFTASAGNAGADRLRSNTFIYVFDDLAAFNAGNDPLQTMRYHTSCSQPIQLGDVIGSVTLVGYVGQDGAASGSDPDLGPGIGDDDADLPTGPAANVGDTVVFTYVVTNTGDASVVNVVVIDDNETADPGDDFNPDPVEEGGFNVGDTDQDNELDPGETWLYTSTVEATLAGQHRNVGKVTGTFKGMMLMDDDPAHHIVAGGDTGLDLHEQGFTMPAVMTFEYTGESGTDANGNPIGNSQADGKVVVAGDPMDAEKVRIIGSDKEAPLDSRAREFFDGIVMLGATFDLSTTFTGVEKDFKGSTYIHILDMNDDLLQTTEFHTSWSQPIFLGDQYGASTLVAFEDQDGASIALPDPAPVAAGSPLLGPTAMMSVDDPFNPGNIGVDADTPTGPEANLGDKVTFTYKVTNTGNVPLTITSLFDDNETLPLPPGTGDDDFEPEPVLVEVNPGEFFNFGDTNFNNLLDPGDALNPAEMWWFQAMEIANEVGQHTNIAKVTAEDDAGTMVMDDDPANYIVVAPGIDIEKFTNGVDADTEADAPRIAPGDTVTWTYRVTNTGTEAFDANEVIVTDDNGTPGDTSDDFNPMLDLGSDLGGDLVLSPGEMWIYTASDVAQDLTVSSTPIVVDFEGLPAGTIVSNQFAGVTISADGTSTVGNAAMIFDSANPTGGDRDLATPGPGVNNNTPLGNVLIISEDLDSSDPDDDGAGGVITFTFDNPVAVDTLSVLDIDSGEAGGSVITFIQAGGSHSVSVPVLGDNSFQRLQIGIDDVMEIQVEFVSSGAVTELVFREADRGCYENFAVVTADGVSDTDLSHYCNPDENPGIDIEKFTNGVDADTEADAPLIAPGDLVTWTYKVTNTGDTNFTLAEVEIVDDAGTPGDTSDDFSTISGDIVLNVSSDAGNDGILSSGEMWIYTASDVAQDLAGVVAGPDSTFNLTGNSSLDGPNGNIRTFSADGISVNASAFSRDSSGVWAEAFLGAFSSGLGVTDTGEGNGGSGRHRVDNVGRHNYVLLEFSQEVIVDQTFLASVVNDSDISVWIGTVADPFNNHMTLSDAKLSGLALNEVNNTGSSSSRWANINAGAVAGNVLVLAASTVDSTPEDRFKIKKVEVQRPDPGCYENMAVVTAGGVSDSDLSHYCNPDPPQHSDDLCFDSEGNKIKLESLTVTYVGAGEVITQDQDGKATVDGDATALSTARILVSDKQDPFADNAVLYFDGVVNNGESFTLDANGLQRKNELKANTYVHIFAANADPTKDQPIQTIVFHTSCSQPLNLNDQFGSITLVGAVGNNGVEVGQPPVPATLAASPVAASVDSAVIASRPQFSGRKVSIELTNHTGSVVTIDHILMDWAARNRQLKKVKFGGATIWGGRDRGGSTVIDRGDFRGNTALRSLGDGQTVTLSFEFKRKVSTDLADYGLTIGFDGLSDLVVL